MQPYMNYLPSQNQMYQQNPYSQNVYSPYDNRVGVQQYQPITNQSQMPTNQPTTLVGRVVENAESITANDVPMTGCYAIFPKSDMKEIYAKAWNSNGQIETLKFALISNEANNSSIEEEKSLKGAYTKLTEVFKDNFAEINDRFDKLERAISSKSASKTRKEVSADE